jgi:hypothetical protein
MIGPRGREEFRRRPIGAVYYQDLRALEWSLSGG